MLSRISRNVAPNCESADDGSGSGSGPACIEDGIFSDLLAQMGYAPKAGQGAPTSYRLDRHYRSPGHYEINLCCLTARLRLNSGMSYLDSFVRSRTNARGSCHVLDLFGSCYFLEAGLATSETGIRWEPYLPGKTSQIADPATEPNEVLGDVFHQDTWTKLEASMSEKQIPSFDLVTMNPVVGWVDLGLKNIAQDFAALEYIIRRVQPKLSTDGEFLFAVSCAEENNHEAVRMAISELVENVKHSSHSLFIPEAGRQITGALLPKSHNVFNPVLPRCPLSHIY